jgi:hypothetical protein
VRADARHPAPRDRPAMPPETLAVVLKRFEQPAEVSEMMRGRFDVVRRSGMTVGRAMDEPGSRRSGHVGHGVGQTRRSVAHVGPLVSGASPSPAVV